jgi:hypothetical protein
MKRHAQRAREFDQFARSGHINARVGVENSKNESIDTTLFRPTNLVLHRFEFTRRVAKVPSTRANENVKANRHLLAHLFDEVWVRGETLNGQFAAKLNPVCASLLCCDRRGNRLHAYFKQDRGTHLDLFSPAEVGLSPLLHMAQSAPRRMICQMQAETKHYTKCHQHQLVRNSAESRQGMGEECEYKQASKHYENECS